MPSGSHRSRGGSHFGGGGSRRSGGSSLGGHSRSRGGFSGSHFGPSRRGVVIHHFGPRRIWLGHRRYYYVGGNSTFSIVTIVLFFTLLFTFVFGVKYSSAKNDLVYIQEDYVYYQDMIDYAKVNNEYIVDATVSGKFYNTYAEKYYITYEIDINSYSKLKGETYSTYTLTETGKYRIGEKIKVAVDSIPITSNTDSIPMDYDGISFEKDGEYVSLKKESRNNLIFLIIGILVNIAIIFLFIRYMRKHSKVEDKDDETKTIEPKPEVTTTTCKYCGGVHDKKKSKCPDCGASLR